MPWYWRSVPLLLMMMAILYLSSQTGGSLPRQVQEYDKILHAVAYGILAAATLIAIQPLPLSRFWLGLMAIFFCTIFGVLDELFQARIPGRVASGWDVLADAAGAATVVGIWWLSKLRNSRKLSR
jgi:VanZ family protein